MTVKEKGKGREGGRVWGRTVGDPAIAMGSTLVPPLTCTSFLTGGDTLHSGFGSGSATSTNTFSLSLSLSDHGL